MMLSSFVNNRQVCNYVLIPLHVIIGVFHALCRSFLCACVKHLNVGPFYIISYSIFHFYGSQSFKGPFYVFL
jgi:hypothetical protein